MNQEQKKALQREVFLAFWRVHILGHAKQEPVVGQWMLKELQRHGYDVSPGTLYPMLHRMEKLGWLYSYKEHPEKPNSRIFFRTTPLGEEILCLIKQQLRELAPC